MSRSPAVLLVALLASFAADAAWAGEPGAPVAAQDEMLVVARSVMPRIAYRGLEPTANPVRVEATVFPGRVFHGVLDGMVQRLVGDDDLGDRAPLLRQGPAAARGIGVDVPVAGLGLGGAGAGPGASRGGGSIGGMVTSATAGIGDRVNQAMQRATGAGVGP